MNTTRLLSSLLVSTLAISSVAQASPEGHYFKKHGKPSAERIQKRFDRMAKKLDLSDVQKQQIKALKENRRNSMKPLREQRKELRGQMATLNPRASDYDQNVAEIANTKAELTRSMTIARGSSRKQMATILTVEQQAKLKKMRANRRGGFRRGFAKRHVYK